MSETPEKNECTVKRKMAKDKTMDKAFKGWLVGELGGNSQCMTCQQIKAETQEESSCV